MVALLILLVFLGFAIALPLLFVGLLLGLLIRLAVGVALIPLKIAGFAVRLTLGLTLGLIALILAGVVLLIPLLPFLALAFVIWMIVRLTRRHPATRLAAD